MKALRIFARIWAGLVACTVGLSAIAHIAAAPTIWAGISDVWDWFSPFNLLNYLLLVILLSPAFGAYALAERMARKSPK